MPSEKFRITTNGQSLRNPDNGFFGMTLSANMTLDESDVSAHNDRRSAHNALERQRREHLNVKFQQLAHALPSLQTVRRPSKTMIVAKSLEFVSSSLKRESNFMTEIQKLRMENEKLKKQAENSSIRLKRQLSSDDAEEDKPVEVKKTSLKRKASNSEEESTTSSQQLSPPPTPEALRGSTKEPKPVAAAANTVTSSNIQPPHKKNRMVKQTKSTLQSQLPPTISSHHQQHQLLVQQQFIPSNTAVPTTPWSPLLDDTTTNNLTYPPNAISSPSNYFDINSTAPYTTPNTNNLTFNTSPNLDMYQPLHMSQQQQYMMNPMLLSPYFVPNEINTAEVAYYQPQQHHHQRDHSNNSSNNSSNNFYLSS